MRLVFNKINKDIFEALRDGIKKVETRAATPKYQNLKEKDIVIFSCDGESFEKEIKKVTHFESIDTLLKKYKPQDINPKLSSSEEIVKMYNSFPGYADKIKESGIIAIELC